MAVLRRCDQPGTFSGQVARAACCTGRVWISRCRWLVNRPAQGQAVGGTDQEDVMVEVRPSGSALGADIVGVDLSRPLTSAEFGPIHGAWMAHLVLRFREQRLTDDALMAFSRDFGGLDGNPRHAKAEGRTEANANAGFVNIISNVVENGRAIGGLGNYESRWHTDMSYNQVPPMASALYALEGPPSGGDTG